jgi:hypothetical protein
VNNENPSGNPAWKPILDAIPPEYHDLIIPQLKTWDKGVQDKFQEIHNKYEEYKAYESLVKNNIDPEYAEKAVILADELQRDPKKLVDQVNQAWNLGYVSAEDANKLGQPAGEEGTGEGDLFDSEDDIFKNPKVKAMQEALNQLQTEFKTTKEQEEEQQALEEFEEYLEELEKSYTDPEREGGPLPFNRTFVTALISQGIDGEAAVKQYHQVLAITPGSPAAPPEGSAETPPVVMGGEGSTGGGTPDGSIDFGGLSKNDLNNTVEQMLAQQANSGQG